MKKKTKRNQVLRQKKRLKNNLLKEWVKAVKERDGYTCCICGKQGTGQTINAHHILPYNGYKELRYDILNGLTLCASCHRLGKNAVHQNSLYFCHWLIENRPIQYYYLLDKLKI